MAVIGIRPGIRPTWSQNLVLQSMTGSTCFPKSLGFSNYAIYLLLSYWTRWEDRKMDRVSQNGLPDPSGKKHTSMARVSHQWWLGPFPTAHHMEAPVPPLGPARCPRHLSLGGHMDYHWYCKLWEKAPKKSWLKRCYLNWFLTAVL